jgi:hypothetical protein
MPAAYGEPAAIFGTEDESGFFYARYRGIPLSAARIISVSVSAEASSLSSTLIALSAANAAVLMEPAIARTQTQCFTFVLIDIHSSSFVWKPGSSVWTAHYLSELAPKRTSG